MICFLAIIVYHLPPSSKISYFNIVALPFFILLIPEKEGIILIDFLFVYIQDTLSGKEIYKFCGSCLKPALEHFCADYHCKICRACHSIFSRGLIYNQGYCMVLFVIFSICYCSTPVSKVAMIW